MTEAAQYFSRELLAWYRANKRDLPWRMNRDPYRIWVSEVMLQQTRVDTVIPYYNRFMDKFPTAAALAAAPEEEVLKCWEGLGYYSRARNLQAGAQEVAERHGGVVPDNKELVSALRGVGPYTTGAIMSIAFNRPEPAVDGNVMRVLSRYFCLEEDIAKPATRVGIEKLAASLIPDGAAGDFNQGLMELGALVCTPKSPGCLTCPVMAHCEGRAAGKEHVLPIKTKAKPPRPERRLAALVIGTGAHEGKILVRQRPDTGLLARMWELPHVLDPQQSDTVKKKGRGAKAKAAEQAELMAESAGSVAAALPPAAVREMQMDALCRTLAAEEKLLVRPTGWWGEAEHVFSHIVWDVQVYRADYGFVLDEETDEFAYAGVGVGRGASQAAAETAAAYEPNGADREAAGLFGDAAVSGDHAAEALPSNYRWIGPEDMRELAFPNVFLRLLREYWI
ncbi:A/G-specific adenine glycosylase [Paenibacillus phyllosphaerae]|uniref:Adenine DNA glycosylase n=1 Tax=Paenibacillus phyllosphaerae TaxID=274593 RepID=A0A7W5B328_9BACL|nr:A/G-specific adenine glycosylase [Paenibacillus phyllosphaerae]MBB3113011.1 A/G-specific adenine glycosylase [Paenibacillus phyllosphaerae]